MTEWDRESVETALKDTGWLRSVREIQHGHQFKLVGGTKVSCFNTGRVLVQGKDNLIKKEVETLFSTQTAPSKHRRSASPTADQYASERKRVFIVYGHDSTARNALELLLRRLNLRPIIFQNMPGVGETIIEKPDRLTKADFACVLITPDDEGRKRDVNDNLRPRARQNVVLELGMVLARLGRHNVAILIKGDDIERPSDVDGLIYIPFTRGVDEVKNQLAASLKRQDSSLGLKV